MDEAGWLMLVAAPLLVSATVGLLFPRAWQRVIFSGVAAAGLYAAALYSMQSDMIRQSAESSTLKYLPPGQVAMEIALVMLPVGLCTGFVFHLFTRFIRTNKA